MTVKAAFFLTPALLLAACGNYEDASVEAQADTVEIPANEPLADVNAVPVADPNANADVAVDEPVEDAANGETAEANDPATPATAPTAAPSPSPAAAE